MSFDVIMMVNNSETNVIGKDISSIMSISGTLKNDTTIFEPRIIFDGNLTSVVSCNYMQIPAFNRYYYIIDIISIRNNLYEIVAKVDVLETYKDQILNNECIIRRQENTWNLYLNDSVFRTYQNPMVLTKPFPSGFTSQSFVMAIAGG